MVFAEMKRDGRMKEVEELLVERQEVLDQHKFYRRMHGVSSHVSWELIVHTGLPRYRAHRTESRP